MHTNGSGSTLVASVCWEEKEDDENALNLFAFDKEIEWVALIPDLINTKLHMLLKNHKYQT